MRVSHFNYSILVNILVISHENHGYAITTSNNFRVILLKNAGFSQMSFDVVDMSVHNVMDIASAILPFAILAIIQAIIMLLPLTTMATFLENQ